MGLPLKHLSNFSSSFLRGKTSSFRRLGEGKTPLIWAVWVIFTALCAHECKYATMILLVWPAAIAKRWIQSHQNWRFRERTSTCYENIKRMCLFIGKTTFGINSQDLSRPCWMSDPPLCGNDYSMLTCRHMFVGSFLFFGLAVVTYWSSSFFYPFSGMKQFLP